MNNQDDYSKDFFAKDKIAKDLGQRVMYFYKEKFGYTHATFIEGREQNRDYGDVVCYDKGKLVYIEEKHLLCEPYDDIVIEIVQNSYINSPGWVYTNKYSDKLAWYYHSGGNGCYLYWIDDFKSFKKYFKSYFIRRHVGRTTFARKNKSYCGPELLKVPWEKIRDLECYYVYYEDCKPLSHEEEMQVFIEQCRKDKERKDNG